MEKLVARGAIGGHSGFVRGLIDACVATAKAEAKKTETLRCAGSIREAAESDEIKECGGSETIDILHCLHDDILRTGGLKVDNGSSQTGNHG